MDFFLEILQNVLSALFILFVVLYTCMIIFMAVFLNMWNQGLDNDAQLSLEKVMYLNVRFAFELYCTLLHCDAVSVNFHIYCFDSR